MAEAFIGFSVHVELTNGSSLEGTVSHIDSHTQLLTLKNGWHFTLFLDNLFYSFQYFLTVFYWIIVNVNTNGRSQQLPIYGVAGTDIKDLSIIASTSPSNIQQLQSNVNSFENGRSPSKSTTPASNNVVNPQSQIQPSTIYSNSPFSDPAIISVGYFL